MVSTVITAPKFKPASSRIRPLRKGIVFIDTTLTSYLMLLAGVTPGYQIVVLDGNRDGIDQISQVLSEWQGLGSIHLVSPGAPGRIQLGTTQLSLDTLKEYTHKLQQWSEALVPNADLLIYGCEVAQGDQGRLFVERLGYMIGAKVAASANRNGHPALGGTWDLEVRTGKAHPPLAFVPEVMTSYLAVV